MFDKELVTYKVDNTEVEAYQVGLNFYHLPEDCRKHLVTPGETYRSIAASYYGNPEFWYHIANMNLKPFFPMQLRGGETILIPNLRGEG